MDIESVISKVAANKTKWANLSPAKKLEYIQKIQLNLAENMDLLTHKAYEKRAQMATESNLHLNAIEKGYIAREGFILSSMVVSTWLYVLNKTYKILSTTGNMPKVEVIDKTYDGLNRVKVGVHETMVSLMFPFCESELIIDGQVKQSSPITKPAGVSAILGAGNQEGITDLLHGLFNLNHVCIYKMSPLSAEFLDVFNAILSPLIDDGFVYILAGGADIGQKMIHSELVDSVIMTGSSTTACQIMWGSPNPPTRLSNQKPLLEKAFLFEAGNCTPWLIAPGKWTKKEIETQCSHLAFAMTLNGGQICGHPQTIITCKNWPQRNAFLECLKNHLKKIPLVTAYYPNYNEKFENIKKKLLTEHTEADFMIQSEISDKNAPTPAPLKDMIFCTDLGSDSFILSQETFCCASGEIPLDTENNLQKFLDVAIPFINKKTTGNLCATISGPSPTTAGEKMAYEEAIAKLKFGSVNFNVFPVLGFTTPFAIWGAQSDMDIYDLESGHGVLGNCYGLENVKKSVIKGSARNLVSQIMSTHPIYSYNKIAALLGDVAKMLCYQKWSQFHLFLMQALKVAFKSVV